MSFFEFPHTRTYDSDLGWLIRHVGANIENIEALQRWAATHRAEYDELKETVDGLVNNLVDVIVPWDSSIAYHIFSIVEYQGTNYIAVQNVPVGAMITNTDYWQPANTVVEQINAIGVTVSDMQDELYNYVTPEMYGGVGDGVADDTTAIQSAIDNEDGLAVYLLEGKTYKTTGTVTLGKNHVKNDGVIDYQGTGYALEIVPTENTDGLSYELGVVFANNGSILHMDSTNGWMQYVNIDFERFRGNAEKDLIRADVVGGNWINEVRFNKGRFVSFLNAVVIDRSAYTGSGSTSHWTFDKVGFEGGTNGVKIPDGITRMSFANCRAEESITNVVLSEAATKQPSQTIVWSGNLGNLAYWQNADNYYITFDDGVINERGSYLGFTQLVYFNKMYYGIEYNEGDYGNPNSFGAYTVDGTTQETDFAIVYDYSTAGADLYNRPKMRQFNIPNNTSAIVTNVYLDDRMFITDRYMPKNSFVLAFTQSPNVPINIYSKKGGTLLYTKAGGSSTTYPRIVISKSPRYYYIEEVNLTTHS